MESLNTGANFGAAVTLSGDRAVVGAPNAREEEGRAYVFARSGDTWERTGRLVPEDVQSKDRFGLTIALDGGRALAGAPGEDGGGKDQGAAYVFGVPTDIGGGGGNGGDGGGNGDGGFGPTQPGPSVALVAAALLAAVVWMRRR